MATIRKKGKNSYQFRVSTGLGADGQYKFKYKTYRVTEKMTPKQLEAHLEHEAYKFEQKVLSNAYISPGSMTFEQFSNEWITKYLEKNVSESTIMNRLNALNTHILPVIGHLNINKVNTMMLLDLMGSLKRKDGKDKPLSTATKLDVHKALTSVFKHAVAWNVISNDPMLNVKKPVNVRKKDEELNVYDELEVRGLLAAAQDELPHWRIFISLALATGMRRGELLGLEWDAIDFENGTIDIQQIIIKSRNGTEVKEPKYNSKRLISIPVSIVEELKEFKKHCREEKMKLQHKWEESNHDWLFFNEEGKHFYPDTPTRWWNRFLTRHEIRKIRLHDLRHTSATLLIAQNVHAKIISERLGHKKISTTMDIYGHALPVADREASDKLNDVFTL